VHIKLLGNLPVGSTDLDEARVASGYLSKYIGKAFDERRTPGLHRYEVAEGFQPAVSRLYGRTASDVLEQASDRMGRGPSKVWRSESEKDWKGPPAVSATWAS